MTTSHTVRRPLVSLRSDKAQRATREGWKSVSKQCHFLLFMYYQFSGSLASCQQASTRSSRLYSVFYSARTLEVGFRVEPQPSPTCGCRKRVFLHQAGAEGSNSEMSDAFWHLCLLQSLRCAATLLSPSCHSVFGNSQLQIQPDSAPTSF